MEPFKKEKEKEKEKNKKYQREEKLNKKKENEKEEKIREKELKEKLILEQQELIEEKLKEPVECRSVILRGLKTTTTEETIIDALKIFGAVEDVRIIRDKGTGESRGFAFVDFFTIEEAKAFMEYNNGSIIIDGCKIQLDYSKPIKPFVFPSGTSFSSGGPIFMTQPPQEFKDWICPQCNGHNFARRKACYKCLFPKPDNPQTCIVPNPRADYYDPDEHLTPCSVLVVRGLDTKTTEEKLWQIFEQFSPSIVALRLIRDKISGVSRGFCFIEFPSVEDAQLCLAACQLQPVVIDGRIVKITYTNRGTYGAAGPYSAISLNGTFLSRTQIQNYYDQTYSWNPDEKSSSNVKCPDILSLINDGTIKSGLVFDSNSGYYYNSLYSIYYDGTSDYYWDSQTGNYYNFDPQTNKYILWQTSSSSNQSKSSNETESSGKGTSKTASSNKKIASSLTNKKISKEIQKWSQKTKELNESEQEELKKQKVSFSVKTKKSNKVIMNNLSNDDEINENTNTTTTTSTTINTEVKNLTNTESTTNLPEINLSNICLLCKRQFNSSETLKKHIAFSELHKKNLELQKQSEKKREGEDNDKLNKKSKSEQ